MCASEHLNSTLTGMVSTLRERLSRTSYVKTNDTQRRTRFSICGWFDDAAGMQLDSLVSELAMKDSY